MTRKCVVCGGRLHRGEGIYGSHGVCRPQQVLSKFIKHLPLRLRLEARQALRASNRMWKIQRRLEAERVAEDSH